MSKENNGGILESHSIPIDIKGLTKILDQMGNCICKIFKNKDETGTGFFCHIPYEGKLFPVLVTTNRIINKEYLNNNKEIKIAMNDGNIEYTIIIDETRKIYLNKDYDIIIIELKEKDRIKNNFLEIDKQLFETNIKQNYEGKSVYIIQYPKGNKSFYSSGVLKELDNYHIKHLCSIEESSSGSPIITLENFTLIGIHCKPGTLIYNSGIFLKEPFQDFINKNLNNSFVEKNEDNNIVKNEKTNKIFEENKSKEIKENSISISIEVKHQEIGKNVSFLCGRNILYGFDPKYRPINNREDIDIFENIKKDDIEIYINNKKYNFQRSFIPTESGFYSIKLKFNFAMEDCRFMFRDCENITRIDLSKFNSKKVTNMSSMFYRCEKVERIILNNLDTSNVTHMDHMFFGCKNLEYLDLFSFNTEKVTSIKYIFSDCENLELIKNLYFNTKNIQCMEYMFFRCLKLCNINLSTFNTENTLCTFAMFADCFSLSSIDLSTFDTSKVHTYKGMLGRCKNLEYIEIRKETYEKIKDQIDELEREYNKNIKIVFNSKKCEIFD